MKISYFFGVYLIASVFILLYCKIDYSADTISYFQIARLYSTGEFTSALNAYWSPLLSWLIAPLLLFSIDPFVAFKIINLVTGLGLLYWTYEILEFWQLRKSTAFAALLTLLGFTFEAQINSFSPDFISACLLIGFIHALLLHKPFYKKIIIGCALVFSKSIFLPIVVFILLLKLYWVERTERKNDLITAASIAAIALFWSALLSLKYEKAILNTSTAYNLELSLERDGYHYNSTAGLIEPSRPGMLFSWQDPSYYPLRSEVPNAEKITARVRDNIFRLAYFLPYSAYGSIGIPLLVVYAFFRSSASEKKILSSTILIIGICLAAYFLFIPENRYFIAPQVLLILTCFYAAEKVSQGHLSIYPYALFLLCLSLSRQTIETFIDSGNRQKLIAQKHQVADSISTIIQKEHFNRIASNSSNEVANILSLVSYKTEVHYYGELGHFMSPKQQIEDLKKYDIDFLCLSGKVESGLLQEIPKESEQVSLTNGITGIILNKK